MSNGYYTGSATTFWTPMATSNTSITWSAPQLQSALDNWNQLNADAERNQRLQDANAAYWERVRERVRRDIEETRQRRLEEAAAARKEAQEVEKRGMQLIYDVLSTDEMYQFQKYKAVQVFNTKSDRWYLVRMRGTVFLLKGHPPVAATYTYGNVYATICIVVPGCTWHDQFVAHYLLCKYDEEYLLRVGNVTFTL